MFNRKLTDSEKTALLVVQNEFALHGHSTDKANKAVFDANLNLHLANAAACRGLKIRREKQNVSKAAGANHESH